MHRIACLTLFRYGHSAQLLHRVILGCSSLFYVVLFYFTSICKYQYYIYFPSGALVLP